MREIRKGTVRKEKENPLESRVRLDERSRILGGSASHK